MIRNWNQNLDSTVRRLHMDAFLEQLQREQRGKAREKDPGLHFYSNDVAMATRILTGRAYQ
ncbi:hypothetical protein OROMI_013578 [Orobanche minor]